jgi:hypothetical protein
VVIASIHRDSRQDDSNESIEMFSTLKARHDVPFVMARFSFLWCAGNLSMVLNVVDQIYR